MIQVEYIGLKPLKTDNVAGSATVWHGPGDIQPVKPEVWAKLKPFDTVWREAAEPATDQSAALHSENPPGPTPDETPQPDAFKYVLQQDGGPDVVLDTMDLDALKAFNNQHKLGVDNRIKKADAFREALFAAATKEG